MDRESNYLLHLLGAFIRQEAPEQAADVDWNRLAEMARIHNVLGILGYMAMTWPICPEERIKAFLRKNCLGTIAAFAARGNLARQLSDDLAQQGIDHIVMKGFVLRQFYPVPELRTFGDIDLVIRQSDREKTHQGMLQRGFQVKDDWEPVYSYKKDAEFYELHTRIMEVDVSDKADYQAFFDGAWEHAREIAPHRYEFTPEFHFLYLLTHIAKHVVGSGAGVRMYLDVAAFVQHYGETLDWASVRQQLDALALTEFAGTVLTLVQSCFGVTAPFAWNTLPEDILSDFLEFTMKGGIFGKEAQSSGVHSLKQESRSSGEVSRTGTLAKRLFPPAASIQSRYTYLEKRPWLLPAAWVHRLVKTGGSWKEHTREARDILSADMGEVQQLNLLYRDIGL